MAGFTELELTSYRPDLALQKDSAVLAEFRGQGIGLAVKGAMLRWATADWSALADVFTATAHDNVHMIRINHALGFTTQAVVVDLESDIAELGKRSASR